MAQAPGAPRRIHARPLAEGRTRVRCFLLRGQGSVNGGAPTARACLCGGASASPSRIVIPRAGAASSGVGTKRGTVTHSGAGGGVRDGSVGSGTAAGASTATDVGQAGARGGGESVAAASASVLGAAALRGVRDGDPGNVVWVSESFDAGREAEAKAELARRAKCRAPAFRRVYEQRAHKFWDKFYARNGTRFFKDRHYLGGDFPDLARAMHTPLSLLEIGCGVGNAMFPLLDSLPHLRAYGLDLSPTAIDLVKQNPSYTPERAGGFVCDVTRDELPAGVRDREPDGCDVGLMLFMLSAMSPDIHLAALRFAYRALKPGGVLLFRDYGRYDAAQVRFAPSSKLADNYYVRADGTCSFFFSTDGLEALARKAGFVVDREDTGARYIRRAYHIRRNTQHLHRVWVEARFVKPAAV